ncbi:hypothetical protein ACFFX0_21600 [Citricoccus parietis]|uniref:Uncharacterized protein n=1 Tax=Citricoccus parietis TaxID=592307 RepID=A0ABV5G3Z7_9MICC
MRALRATVVLLLCPSFSATAITPLQEEHDRTANSPTGPRTGHHRVRPAGGTPADPGRVERHQGRAHRRVQRTCGARGGWTDLRGEHGRDRGDRDAGRCGGSPAGGRGGGTHGGELPRGRGHDQPGDPPRAGGLGPAGVSGGVGRPRGNPAGPGPPRGRGRQPPAGRGRVRRTAARAAEGRVRQRIARGPGDCTQRGVRTVLLRRPVHPGRPDRSRADRLGGPAGGPPHHLRRGRDPDRDDLGRRRAGRGRGEGLRHHRSRGDLPGLARLGRGRAPAAGGADGRPVRRAGRTEGTGRHAQRAGDP